MSNVAEESIEAIPSEDLQARRRAQVMRLLVERPGETNEGISEALGLPIQSVTPRTRELKESGRIWITGKRETSSGRMAAEMSPASCPLCGERPERIAPWGEGGFVYRCPCGCEYIALVGPSRNQSAAVSMVGAEEDGQRRGGSGRHQGDGGPPHRGRTEEVLDHAPPVHGPRPRAAGHRGRAEARDGERRSRSS